MNLGRFFRRSRPAAGRPRFRPQLEGLEERLVLNNRFVVPTTQADNVANFATLQAALKAPGLATGDVIQIEPGSVPGFIGSADLPKVQNLTIQGDPTVNARSLPAFVASDLIIQQATNNLTLKNVHVAIDGGIELLDANATITRSFLEANIHGSIAEAIDLVGSTATVIANNEIICTNASGSTSIVTVDVTNNSHNVFSGNTVVNNSPDLETVVTFNNLGAADATVDDRFVHNTFNVGEAALVFAIHPGVNGLDIEDNVVTGGGTLQTGIEIEGPDRQLTIRNNRIDLDAAPGSVALFIAGHSAGTLTSAVIADNDLSTGQGTGMQIFLGNDPNVLQLQVEGNDFHHNQVGVNVTSNGGTAVNVDLGGGTQHSLGGNDFRGFTAAASSTSGAIVSNVDALDGDMVAQGNLFSVNPRNVVFDGANLAGLDHIDVSGNLTGNAAIVQSLFVQFLRRAGDLSSPQDAGGLVNALNHGTPLSTVVDDVVRSQEALGIQVEQLYQQFLGRDASAAEQAAWVTQIQHGQTLESVTAQILISAEYRSLFVDDSAFVRSLYRGLLHRDGSAAEIASWVADLPTIGRAGVVQGFLTSQEFRAVQINDDYANLLHRAPAASEVNGWLATKFDALTLDEAFASSPEYQTNG
jgi:hypothetical protein